MWEKKYIRTFGKETIIYNLKNESLSIKCDKGYKLQRYIADVTVFSWELQ